VEELSLKDLSSIPDQYKHR